MSLSLYTKEPETKTWEVEATGVATFTWEYDENREYLLNLYQKGKDKQWDALSRIEWDLDVDPYDALGLPDEMLPMYGTDTWRKLSKGKIDEIRLHTASAQFSQFLHGEQGALICAARIVESVPDLDSKFYAATQVMDEARHVEVFSKFVHEKIGMVYPLNQGLQELLDNTLSDSRWDLPYLGMQVLIEGLALAAFGALRDVTNKPLPKQILAYVMQDEARHVAFGRIALRDYYKELSAPELKEREDFVIEGTYRMNQRFQRSVLWDRLGFDPEEAEKVADASPGNKIFRQLLFSRLVPCVKDIGLWSPRMIEQWEKMGVLDAAGGDLDALMKSDEDAAEALDAERFAREEFERATEVTATINSVSEEPVAFA
jgi:hypothetical protein